MTRTERFDRLERSYEEAASPGIRPGLARLARLLQQLGHPERSFRGIHVVGTNGKGSTASTLASILSHSGYKTALYTSPHLRHIGERVLISGVELPVEAWEKASEKVLRILKEDSCLLSDLPTVFEILTAVAFTLICESQVDFAVMEAGMGGRFDATNIWKGVLGTLVTPIAMDHTEFLGNTLEKIASEKFAVIRPGGRALFSGYPELDSLFLERCKKMGAEGEILARDWKIDVMSVDKTGCAYDLWSPSASLKGIKTPLVGPHQIANTALACAAALSWKEFFPHVNPDSIRLGVSKTVWPGRMEWIHKNPDLILDGAHNLHGVQALARTLEALGLKNEPKVFVFTSMKDKDYRDSLALLSCFSGSLYATVVPGLARSETPEKIRDVALEVGFKGEIRCFEDPMEAIREATRSGKMTLCCGSLYLVGYVRSHLLPEDEEKSE